MIGLISWVLIILAPFVIGALLAGGTVWEGIGLFLGLSIAFILFKIIFGSIMQARKTKGLNFKSPRGA